MAQIGQKILLDNKVQPARKIVEKMWCDNTNMLLKLSNPTAFTLGKIIDIVDRAREQEHVNSKTRSSYVFLGLGYKFYAPLALHLLLSNIRSESCWGRFLRIMKIWERLNVNTFPEKSEFGINLENWGKCWIIWFSKLSNHRPGFRFLMTKVMWSLVPFIIYLSNCR